MYATVVSLQLKLGEIRSISINRAFIMSSKLSEALTIAVYVVSGVAVIGNLLVLVVFAATKQLRIKYYGFVLSLAIADIVGPVIFIVFKSNRSPIVAALFRGSFFVAQLNVLAVAVNRLMALSILPPARYDAIVTRGRIVGVCVLFWVISAVLFVPTAYHDDTPAVIRLVRPLATLLILVITAVVYRVVFHIISRYRPPLASTPGITEDDEQTKTRVRQTRHLMVTFSVILVTSLLCWIPNCVANMMIFFSSSQSIHGQSYNFLIFFRVALLILVLNSAANPFIYWWRISEVRAGLRTVLLPGQ